MKECRMLAKSEEYIPNVFSGAGVITGCNQTGNQRGEIIQMVIK